MDRLVTTAANKLSFESTFNSSLCMSNASFAKIQYKIDKERIRHEKEVRLLNKSEKEELRLTQRELEEVKRELHTLRAYKVVAQQTAFKRFDRMELKKKEQREKAKRNVDEMANLPALERPSPAMENDQGASPRTSPSRRQSSVASGDVLMTIRDIIDRDDILRKHSIEISKQRQQLDSKEESFEDEENYCKRVRAPLPVPKISIGETSVEKIEEPIKKQEDTLKDEKVLNEKYHCKSPRRRSRISSVGELVENTIAEDIQAEKEEAMKMEWTNSSEPHKRDNYQHKGHDTSKGSKAATVSNGVFITSSDNYEDEENIDSMSKTQNYLMGASRPSNVLGQRPMTLFQISKLYEQKKAQTLHENENKLMNTQRRKAQKEYQQFRMKLRQKELERQAAMANKMSFVVNPDPDSFDTGQNNSGETPCIRTALEKTKKIEIPNSQSEKDDQKSPRTMSLSLSAVSRVLPSRGPKHKKQELKVSKSAAAVDAPRGDTSAEAQTMPNASAPSKGLARFKNAATAVTVQQRLTRNDNRDRMKNAAAAIMIKSNTTTGRIPTSFMSGGNFTWVSPRDDTKTDTTPLEASHRNPDDVKIRPLEMPRGVQEEHERKWGDLMVNVHYAVFWKAKALREDTGTLNSRQMRRMVKEKPPPRRALFPGECKTTWAMKKYVQQEIGGVLESWRPENVRKKRNKKLIDKLSLPMLVDRVRTTTSILKSFRDFKNENDHEKNERDEDADDLMEVEEAEESNELGGQLE